MLTRDETIKRTRRRPFSAMVVSLALAAPAFADAVSEQRGVIVENQAGGEPRRSDLSVRRR